MDMDNEELQRAIYDQHRLSATLAATLKKTHALGLNLAMRQVMDSVLGGDTYANVVKYSRPAAIKDELADLRTRGSTEDTIAAAEERLHSRAQIDTQKLPALIRAIYNRILPLIEQRIAEVNASKADPVFAELWGDYDPQSCTFKNFDPNADIVLKFEDQADPARKAGKFRTEVLDAGDTLAMRVKQFAEYYARTNDDVKRKAVRVFRNTMSDAIEHLRKSRVVGGDENASQRTYTATELALHKAARELNIDFTRERDSYEQATVGTSKERAISDETLDDSMYKCQRILQAIRLLDPAARVEQGDDGWVVRTRLSVFPSRFGSSPPSRPMPTEVEACTSWYARFVTVINSEPLKSAVAGPGALGAEFYHFDPQTWQWIRLSAAQEVRLLGKLDVVQMWRAIQQLDPDACFQHTPDGIVIHTSITGEYDCYPSNDECAAVVGWWNFNVAIESAAMKLPTKDGIEYLFDVELAAFRPLTGDEQTAREDAQAMLRDPDGKFSSEEAKAREIVRLEKAIFESEALIAEGRTEPGQLSDLIASDETNLVYFRKRVSKAAIEKARQQFKGT